MDAVWDDGVAPELALDFDQPNWSSWEALYAWAGGLSMFVVVFQIIKHGAVPKEGRPALSMAEAGMIVDKDWSNHDETPLDAKDE